MVTLTRESKLTYEQSLLYNTSFKVKLYEDGGVWFAAGLEPNKRDIFQLSNIGDIDVLHRIKDKNVTGLVSWGCTSEYYYEWMLFSPVDAKPLTNVQDRPFFTKSDFDILHHQGDFKVSYRNAMFIRVVCPQGRVQSLRQVNSAEAAASFFSKYKREVQAVHSGKGGNPAVAHEWLESLTYTLEDRQGNLINEGSRND